MIVAGKIGKRAAAVGITVPVTVRRMKNSSKRKVIPYKERSSKPVSNFHQAIFTIRVKCKITFVINHPALC